MKTMRVIVKTMRVIKITTALLFALMVLLPLALFRREPGIVSEIDNRMLQENPFSPEERAKGGDLTAAVERYVSDRIGLRDEMIQAYTLLNDRLFGEMVHPSYTYGKDGYVFFKMAPGNRTYGEFEESFADMVREIQDYCEARSVPFVFAFEPSKTTVLEEYLPEGVNYDSSWIDRFLEALRERGVRCVDNREILLSLHRNGVEVFNRQYDAGHWNAVGAFYGVNAILEELQKDFPGIHVNTWEEMTVSERREEALPASRFPIDELVPKVGAPCQVDDRTAVFGTEVSRHPSFRTFGDYVNPQRLAEGSPRTLVFQGSYMNGQGGKFLMNALGEDICVHNYQNVIDFDYYFNIFKPECVIFEVTEYAMTEGYFDLDRMRAMDLNPALPSALAEAGEPEELPLEGTSVQRGEALTKLTWTGGHEWIPAGEAVPYVWAVLGDEPFDMRQSEESVWEVTVKNEVWDKYEDGFQIVTLTGEALQEYS